MKILSIAGHNLNSLRVEFKVDFSTGVLKDCGIFAITGPTGAGKTTLLDAITLALYGKTPRAANDEDIISYGASEARAEVVFQTAEGRFKSEWKVRRARGKHDGSVQQSSMEVSTYPEGKILTQKKRDALEKVKDLIKLEYDQFLKSVLLAQGAFKAFLDAKEGERGEMLEKLSDTSLYTKLSKRAFERKKTEEQALEKLRAKAGNVVLLAEEERVTHQNTISLLKNEGMDLQEDLNMLHIKFNWLRTIRDLKAKQAAAEKELELARQQLEQEQFNIRRWEAHLLVSALEIQWVQYRQKKAEQQQVEQQIESLHSRLLFLSKTLQEAIHSQQHAQKQLELAVQIRQEKMPLVLGAITRQADLRAEEKQLGVIREKLRLKLLEEKDCETKRLAGEKTLASKIKALEELELWLDKHRNYAEAGNSCTEATLLVSQLKRTTAEMEELKLSITKSQEQLLSAEKKMGLAKENERQAETDQQSLQQLHQTTSHQLSILKSRLNKQAWQNEEIIGESRQVLEAMQGELSKQQFLAEHLTKLHEGESCPLCGSKEHPNQTLSTKDVQEEISRLQSGIKQHQGINNVQRLQQATIERLLQSLEEYPEAQDLAQGDLTRDFDKQVNELLQVQRSLPQKQHQASMLQMQAGQLQQSLKEQVADLESRKADTTHKLTNHGISMGSNITALEDIARVYNLQFDRNYPEKLPETLKEYGQQYYGKAMEASVTRGTIPGIEGSIETLSLQVQQIRNDHLQLQQDILEKEAIIKQFSDEINAAHTGYPSPEAARDQLNKAEKAASDQLKQSTDHLGRLQKEAGTLEGEKEYAEKNIKDLDRSSKELADILKAALVDLNLGDDINTIKELLLVGSERQKLGQLHKHLYEKMGLSEAHLASCISQLQLQQSLQITGEEEDDIAASMKEVRENLNEKYNQVGQLEQILKDDEAKQEKIRFIKQEIEAQEKVFEKWAALSALIGSENGKKFNQFAQGLTLDRLLVISNHHLQLLNNRYLLKRNIAEQGLGLLIIDQYQSDNEREIKTLSGGESFLVSLALALGLSEMTSKLTTIDSLFIDEGFGTLDADTLEVALGALRGLQIGGKTIGIISHVERLKEEIYTQVEITKGPDGFSTLRVIPES